MEEKKFDFKSIIGFLLISGVLVWMMSNNSTSKEQVKTNEPTENEQVVTETTTEANKTEGAQTDNKTAVTNGDLNTGTTTDSIKAISQKALEGTFEYAATLPTATNAKTNFSNELLDLTISNKGGYLSKATIKNFEQFTKGSGLPVDIIKDNNASFNLVLHTADNKILQTKDLYFEPTVTTEGKNKVVTMRLKAGENQFLEYRYVLKPNDYMLDFSIRSQGLEKVINPSKAIDLQWAIKTYRNEKSVSYENRYTELVFEYEDGKDDYLNAQSKLAEDTADKVTYVAFKQHLFTSILLTDTPFQKSSFSSQNLVDESTRDTIFTKQFKANLPLEVKNGNVAYNMNMYYGPSKYQILNAYDRNLDEVLPLGWGIFGWINRYIFIPVFGFISGIGIGYGISIIIFTILVRLVMSPFTYKSYVSQAKMKVLRPEIAELSAKYKDNAMKKQQETMKLYSKAGVNPMAGCLPALLQMPVFYALFQFFPSMFDLRQKNFLWADDLSSFDAILTWKQEIPIITFITGNHISLFALLAAVAIFFYMKMTTGDQQMSAPQQEGMPDMAKIMKIMIYISPVMMLFFFNNYASGLSLYYFVSNLITIGIMLVIKNYIVKEDKILAQINENKAKPKQESKFQRKMREMMEQAEAQKKIKK